MFSYIVLISCSTQFYNCRRNPKKSDHQHSSTVWLRTETTLNVTVVCAYAVYEFINIYTTLPYHVVVVINVRLTGIELQQLYIQQPLFLPSCHEAGIFIIVYWSIFHMMLMLSVGVVVVIVRVIIASMTMVLTKAATCGTIINILGTHHTVRS